MGIIFLVPIRIFAHIYLRMPRKWAMMLGSALGFVLRKAGLRSSVVRENLQIAFPNDPDRREQLYLEAYRHLGNLILEILGIFGPMRRFVLKYSELRGWENWKAAHDQGKGVIFLASHVGNWELMAVTGAVFGQMDSLMVTKHLKPEWFHQGIEAGRALCQLRATYEPRTMRDILAHFKRGGTVGFVLDQYAGPPIGVRVPVFGVPVGTSTAIAMLARRSGVPVVPVVNYRQKNGRYVVEIRPALKWEQAETPELSIAINTAHYAKVLEKDIYDHPDQWLWTHRRFKGDLSPLREGEWIDGRARR